MDSLKLRLVQQLRLYVSRLNVWLYGYEYKWLKQAERQWSQDVLAEFGSYVDWAWIERQKAPWGTIHYPGWPTTPEDKRRCREAQQDREAYCASQT